MDALDRLSFSSQWQWCLLFLIFKVVSLELRKLFRSWCVNFIVSSWGRGCLHYLRFVWWILDNFTKIFFGIFIDSLSIPLVSFRLYHLAIQRLSPLFFLWNSRIIVWLGIYNRLSSNLKLGSFIRIILNRFYFLHLHVTYYFL